VNFEPKTFFIGGLRLVVVAKNNVTLCSAQVCGEANSTICSAFVENISTNCSYAYGVPESSESDAGSPNHGTGRNSQHFVSSDE
jgi:hypothetical protein